MALPTAILQDETRLATMLQEILTGQRIVRFQEEWVGIRFPKPVEYSLGLLEYDRHRQYLETLGVPSEKALREVLRTRDLWTNQDGELDALEAKITQHREQLLSVSERVYPVARKRLIQLEVDRDFLLWERRQWFEHTAEAHAHTYRARYLLPFCVRDPLTDTPRWPNYATFAKAVPPDVAQDLLLEFLQFLGGVETAVLRYLARGGSPSGNRWRLIWNAAKKVGAPLFTGNASTWDVNQLQLAYWSAFYDGVYEHFERPPQRVIETDALLDQWAEEQQREMEERAQDKRHQVGMRSEDYDEMIVFDPSQDYSPDNATVQSVGPRGMR